MKPPADPMTFEELLRTTFPDLFGDEASHQCDYRTHLFELIKSNLQERTMENLAGEYF